VLAQLADGLLVSEMELTRLMERLVLFESPTNDVTGVELLNDAVTGRSLPKSPPAARLDSELVL